MFRQKENYQNEKLVFLWIANLGYKIVLTWLLFNPNLMEIIRMTNYNVFTILELCIENLDKILSSVFYQLLHFNLAAIYKTKLD